MGGYFQPLRRKIGMMILLTACVVMMGWVRSLTYTDEIQVFLGQNTVHQLISNKSGLAWVSTWGAITDRQGNVLQCARVLRKPHHWMFFEPSRMSYWETSTVLDAEEKGDVFGYSFDRSFPAARWYWKCIGFCFGTEDNPPERAAFLTAPYWSLTIPLTLISLWLLLSKPRKSNQMKITEPDPEKAA